MANDTKNPAGFLVNGIISTQISAQYRYGTKLWGSQVETPATASLKRQYLCAITSYFIPRNKAM
jgi:hypothetical protein